MKLNSLQILFIDFFDSFSHNIIQIIGDLGHRVDVMSYLRATQNPDVLLHHDLVVLGPGPGHVDDYLEFCDLLKKVNSTQSFLGICLGHQILGVINGHGLVRLKYPVHGVSSSIPSTYAYMDINSTQNKAMFYNSWSLRSQSGSVGYLHYENDQVTLIDLPNALGLQFHPESVGTSCPYEILDTALKLVYNKGNEDTNENYWSLRSKNNSATPRTKDL